MSKIRLRDILQVTFAILFWMWVATMLLEWHSHAH